MMSMSEYKSRFAESPGYLNYASFGPPSTNVTNTVKAMLDAEASGNLRPSGAEGDARQRAITAFASLSGFAPANIALTPNTSSGLLQVAFGLQNERLLFNAADFPANTYPWYRASQMGLIRIERIVQGREFFTIDTLRSDVTKHLGGFGMCSRF